MSGLISPSSPGCFVCVAASHLNLHMYCCLSLECPHRCCSQACVDRCHCHVVQVCLDSGFLLKGCCRWALHGCHTLALAGPSAPS